MVGSMFAAVSGLKAHQTRMDVIGNNIANVNTWGFKAQTANFMDATYRNKIAGAAGAAATGGGGGVNPSQIGYGANVGSITTNFATGNWNPTGWGSDCMINGPAYFVVMQKTGTAIGGAGTDISKENVLLSRVGILKIDSEGYLVDAQGNYLVGSDGAIIQPGKGSKTFSSLTVQTDGTVTGVVATGGNEGDVEEIGKLGLAVVENPSGLEKTEGYYYRIGANAGIATLMAADKAITGEILGGYLEMSNTDLSTEMTSMITTQRGFQANTKIITVTDQMLEELVNIKR